MRISSADRESQSISDLVHSFDFNGLQTVRAEIHIPISIYISSGIQIVYSLCTFYNCEAIAAMLAQFISRRQYQTADSGLGSGNNWPHSLSMITRRRRAIDAAFSSTGFVVVFFLVSFLDQAIAYRVGLRPGTGSRFLVLLLLLLLLLLDVSTVQQKLLLQEIVTEHKKIYIVFLMHCGLFELSESLGFIGHKRHAGGLRKSVNGFTISSLYPLHLRRLHFECTHLYALPETQKIWGPVYTTRPIQINSPINYLCLPHM